MTAHGAVFFGAWLPCEVTHFFITQQGTFDKLSLFTEEKEMTTCALMGDFNTGKDCVPAIKNFIRSAIRWDKVDTFVIYGYGEFALIVADELAKAKSEYPHIKCKILLSFWEDCSLFDKFRPGFEILFFRELAFETEKFAIAACHRMILCFSDIIGIYNYNLFPFRDIDMSSKKIYDLTLEPIPPTEEMIKSISQI